MQSTILHLPNTDKIDAKHRSVLENEKMSTTNTKITRQNTSTGSARKQDNIMGHKTNWEKRETRIIEK